ncbi:hypothetical protein CDAR_440071 [Caerostris darwini]|uniref:Uncharacterized protein n=1 Tax=Caerostris darwini TaxID=1538125 RepID=A0AAV4RKV3_9ARAC|nr:hypothetical protein CDAR_440071 [Caerostris darwini]
MDPYKERAEVRRLSIAAPDILGVVVRKGARSSHPQALPSRHFPPPGIDKPFKPSLLNITIRLHGTAARLRSAIVFPIPEIQFPSGRSKTDDPAEPLMRRGGGWGALDPLSTKSGLDKFSFGGRPLSIKGVPTCAQWEG